MASRRVEPRRANTKDSWLTIDWGKPQPPSALHGVMDQIAGTILRDRDLIAQGKREWSKAAAIRRARRRKGNKSGSGTSTPRQSNTIRNLKRDPSRRGGRVAAGARKTSKDTGIKGFFGTLFSSKSKASSSARKRTQASGAVKRSLTRPGQHGSHSTSKARPSAHRHQSSRRQ